MLEHLCNVYQEFLLHLGKHLLRPLPEVITSLLVEESVEELDAFIHFSELGGPHSTHGFTKHLSFP